MSYLVLVSFIWAFSFGLIKGQLTGMDPYFVSFIRLFVSFLFFAPFLRRFQWKDSIALMMIGAVQFGLMYILYIYSYQFLAAWQIALFTVFTPLYVTIIADLWQRRLNGMYLLATLIAVFGGVLVAYDPINQYRLSAGFVLIQGANICFALGQVAYKNVRHKYREQTDRALMPMLFLGGVLVTLAVSLVQTDYSTLQISAMQTGVLFYLGIVASGIGFFLWNTGVTRVNSGALAVMNNVKAPLAILVSVFIFSESGLWGKAILGAFLIFGALLLTAHNPKKDELTYEEV